MKKRILSLILIFVISACSISVFSADASAESGKYEYVNSILETIGVFERSNLSGKEFNQKITRGEFLSFVMSVVYPDATVYENAVSPFTDVSVDDGIYKYICVAQKFGVISGNGNGEFRPNAPITYAEAVKIMVSILGYENEANSKGGFPAGFYAQAKSLGLDDGIKNKDTSDMTYGDSLVLLLNAFNTEVNEVKVYSTDESVSFYKGETLLYNTFEIKYGRGVLKENPYTTLYSPKGEIDNTVVIGDFYGKLYGGISAENYIGYEVDFYYQVDKAGNFVIYLEPIAGNKVTTISSEDGVTVSGREVSWYPGNSDNKKTITIPGGAKIIYNGKAYPDYEMSIFETKDAEFNLVDSDRDGKIDVVNITAWESVFVYGVDTEEETIVDKFDGSDKIELKKADEWIIWDKAYNRLSLEDVKAGMVATVVKSLDGKYLRVIVSDSKAMGSLKSSKTKRGNTVIVLDGKEYVLADSYAKKMGVMPPNGTEITVYLDYNGKVGAIETGLSAYEYGFLIGAVKENSLDSTLEIKMLMSNGKVSVVEAADNLKIDESKYTDSMMSILNTPQVVRYLAYEGVIRKIDTVEKGESESENSLRALTKKGWMKYIPQSKIFAGPGLDGDYSSKAATDSKTWYVMMPTSSSTKYMIVPESTATDKRDEDYTIQPLTYFGSSSKVGIYQGFNANASSYIPDIVYLESTGGNLSRGDNTMIVTEITTGISDDGDVVTALGLIDRSGTTYERFYTEELDETGVKVNVGDVINYSMDMRGYIKEINIIYSADLRSFHPDNKYKTQYIGDNFNPNYGKVYDREGDIVVYTIDVEPDKAKYEDFKFVTITSVPVFVVEEIRGEYQVRQGSASDIYDYKHFGEASDMFYYTYQTTPRIVVVYR